jgi:hypothetical protein
MGRWILDNLGDPKHLHIDRINNNGHYEPENLRITTSKVNMNNKRHSNGTRNMHLFRQNHPEIKYSDSTLIGMFSRGMTYEQIIEKFYKKSNKPKGLYGTYSIPDQEIVLLAKDC